MRKNIFGALLMVLTNACVQTVDFPIAFDRKLVVHGFIGPVIPISGDSIVVSVATNSPVVGNIPKAEVTDASVTLSGSAQMVTLPLMPKSASDLRNQVRRYGISRKQFTVKSGESYSLSVKTLDGLQTQGSCKIPQRTVAENDIKIELLEKSKDKIRLKIGWKDIADEDNFYLCSVLLVLVGNNGQLFLNEGRYIKDTKAINNFQTSDELTFSNFNYDYDSSKSIIYVAIANIEKNYYDWGITQVLQQRQTQANLFPEPVLLNHNMSNGLGIFTGYNATFIGKRL
jgi:hypothetical protein